MSLSVRGYNKMTLTDIWKIEDKNSLILALDEHVAEKCAYGGNMDALSEQERIFYIVQTLEKEVNNGGFSQFFYNSSGDFSGELLYSLAEIGADEISVICGKALNAFGCEIPVDRGEREELLDDMESNGVDEIFDECDDEFYNNMDILTELSYAYVMKHRTDFS